MNFPSGLTANEQENNFSVFERGGIAIAEIIEY